MKNNRYTLNNILNYIQGNVRYQLYYSKFAFLIPIHIREQIDARINSMDKQCYLEGQCKMCGCSTTALQMCDKACDKPCYPPMLNKQAWGKFKSFKYFPFGEEWWKLEIREDKMYFFNSATNIELFKDEEADGPHGTDKTLFMLEIEKQLGVIHNKQGEILEKETIENIKKYNHAQLERNNNKPWVS